ncbi:alpha/beta fold hydrolase [Kineococcus sp. SYSU DK006]|uniref:alpha/beta fold hydrolase n=1 Tax=Kineococcus sp. SYSU DK006 TaxID=3383127 RepID=UPI003D7E56BC
MSLRRRTALRVLLTPPALLAGGAAGERLARWSGRPPAPAGSLRVDVGSAVLHLVRRGGGVGRGGGGADGPVVVLEAGSGETSASFARVLQRWDLPAPVVAYDRAGYGRSTASALARTGANVVAELREALRRSGAEPPYVLVGHSMGGLFVREFAAAHPAEVAGLVLVDARPEDDARRTAELLRTAGPAAQPSWRLLAALAETGALRTLAPVLLGASVPADARAEFLDVTASPAYFRAREQEAAAIGATEDRVRGQFLGDLPVAVVARGVAQDYAAAGIDAATGRRLEEVWQDGQRRLLGLSRRTRSTVATGSGHLVPRERPDAVLDAVRWVLDEIGRTPAPSALADPPRR